MIPTRQEVRKTATPAKLDVTYWLLVALFLALLTLVMRVAGEVTTK